MHEGMKSLADILINMEWFNEMSNMDKYFFILSEGILVLMFLFMLPTLIKTIKEERRK
jgi:hypothetical protein